MQQLQHQVQQLSSFWPKAGKQESEHTNSNLKYMHLLFYQQVFLMSDIYKKDKSKFCIPQATSDF